MKVIIIITFLCLSLPLPLYSLNNDGCSKTRSIWLSHKYPFASGLAKVNLPKNGSDLCSNSKCCDRNTQIEMLSVSNLKLKSIVENHWKELIDSLNNHSSKLNDYFQSDLEQLRINLHNMFSSTYSESYKQNQKFFHDFFDKLKQYINGGEQNIETIMDQFFQEVAERMIEMMTVPKKEVDVIRCMADHFMKLNPYQGADVEIKKSILNSYPPARMTINSIRAISDEFTDLMNIKSIPTLECSESYGKLYFCSLCSGNKVVPCKNDCITLKKKCFGSLNPKEVNQLSKAWIKLLTSIDNLIKRLNAPFSLTQINKNLHLKISEAIMNVHNYFPNVKQEMLKNCNAASNRVKRSALGSQTWNNNYQTVEKKEPGESLIDIVRSFTTKLPEWKNHLKDFKKSCLISEGDTGRKGENCWSNEDISKVRKGGKKSKGGKKNLKSDINGSITRISEITSTVNLLLSGQNKDPTAFKIKYVPKPKKVGRQIPQSETMEPIEGSGEVESSLKPTTTAKPLEKEQFPLINEGSGENRVPVIVTSTQRPVFPKLPTGDSKDNRKQVITDDEDVPIDSVDNKNPDNTQIQGSGKQSGRSGQMPEILPGIIVQVTTETKSSMTTSKPLVPVDKGVLTEGSGSREYPDYDTTNTKKPDNPSVIEEFQSMLSTTTETAALHSKTPPQVMLNELPGDIPNEIWIPQVINHDSPDRLVSKPNHASIYRWSIISALLGCSAVIFTENLVFL